MLRRWVLVHGNVPETRERGRAPPRWGGQKWGRAARAPAPNRWSQNSPYSFRHGKEFFEAAQPFLDAVNRSRIGKTDVTGGAERIAGNADQMLLFEKHFRERR